MNKKQLIGIVLFIFLLVLSSVFVSAGRGNEGSNSTYASFSYEDVNYGKVQYDTVTSNLSQTDLEAGISIKSNIISINSAEYPELNTDARIYFYNTGYTGDVIVYEDNVQCVSCKPVQSGNDSWYVDVEHFSTYTLNSSDFASWTLVNTEINGDGTLDKQGDAGFLMFGPNCDDNPDQSKNAADNTTFGAVDCTFGGINGTALYNFSGASMQYINFTHTTQNSMNSSTDEIITIVTRVRSNETSGTTNYFYNKQGEVSLHYRAGNTIMYSFGDNSGSFTISDDPNGWHNLVWTFYEGKNYTLYLDGAYAGAGLTADTSTGTGDFLIIGGQPYNGIFFSGEIDYLFYLKRELSESEIIEFNNSINPPTYKQDAYAISDVKNATDGNPEIMFNIFDYLNASFLGTITELQSLAARADSCSDISTSTWLNGSEQAPQGDTLIYNFTATSAPPTPELEGNCSQIYLTWENNRNISANFNQFNITFTSYFMPYGTSSNIEPAAPEIADNVLGNATFELNDTDTGWMHFLWFVDGNNVYNETISTLTNGTIAQSTLPNTYTTSNALVYYQYIANNSLALSEVGTSSSVMVNNTDFSVSYTPENTTLSVTKPRLRIFRALLNDTDGDVNVTWQIGDDVVGSGTTYTFYPNNFDDYAIINLQVNVTDGQYNETNNWDIEILPPEVQAVAGIAIVIFLVTVIGFLLIFPYFMRDFIQGPITNLVVRRGMYVLATFLTMLNASIVANIAEASGLDLTGELFGYMWIFSWLGYILAAILVLLTIYDVVNLAKRLALMERMGDDDGEY